MVGRVKGTDVQALHRARIETIRNEAIALGGTVSKIAAALTQALEKGGAANIQPQIAYLTGAHARMLKDWGVVEQLQQHGVTQRKPPQVQ